MKKFVYIGLGLMIVFYIIFLITNNIFTQEYFLKIIQINLI